MTCCQGWNKSGRCQELQSYVSDQASTFPAPAHHITLNHQIGWNRNLEIHWIRWAVPVPSTEVFPVCHRGAEISESTVETLYACYSFLTLYMQYSTHKQIDNLSCNITFWDSTMSYQHNVTSQPVPYSSEFVGSQQALHSALPDINQMIKS